MLMTKEKMDDLKLEFRSKYYNAVSDACFNILVEQNNKRGISDEDLTKKEYQEVIEDAHEWFMAHFFDEHGIK